jgi:hypothetical protein
MFASILDHVTKSLWLSAWADAVERAADRSPKARDLKPGPGGDWADCSIGREPRRFRLAAHRALCPLREHVLEACKAWRDLTGCDVERFGHVVAMRLLGSGVGLFDDFPSYLLQGGTVTDAAKRDHVRRLDRELPMIGESVDVYAEWDFKAGKVR